MHKFVTIPKGVENRQFTGYATRMYNIVAKIIDCLGSAKGEVKSGQNRVI